MRFRRISQTEKIMNIGKGLLSGALFVGGTYLTLRSLPQALRYLRLKRM
jgi:hypothetical protein